MLDLPLGEDDGWFRGTCPHSCHILFEMSFIDETGAKRREPLPSCWDVPFERLETLADVFAYAAAEGVTLRIDGTEVQVRRPRANRTGRKAFVSGNKKQNTMKPTVP